MRVTSEDGAGSITAELPRGVAAHVFVAARCRCVRRCQLPSVTAVAAAVSRGHEQPTVMATRRGARRVGMPDAAWPRSPGGPTGRRVLRARPSGRSAAVVVTDRLGNLLYANAYAAKLFGFPDDAEHLAGRSHPRARFRGGGPRQGRPNWSGRCCAARAWEGTFAIRAARRIAGLRPGPGGAAAPAVRRDRRDRDHRPRGDPAHQPARAGPDRAAGADRRAAGRLAGARRSRCGTWPRRWSRSSPTTASSTCSTVTS